jgi:hypothetical protein
MMKATADPDKANHDFLEGGGALAELIRANDWATTPLGPIETWPQSLRTTVSLCLASNFPINIIWGLKNTQMFTTTATASFAAMRTRARSGKDMMSPGRVPGRPSARHLSARGPARRASSRTSVCS